MEDASLPATLREERRGLRARGDGSIAGRNERGIQDPGALAAGGRQLADGLRHSSLLRSTALSHPRREGALVGGPPARAPVHVLALVGLHVLHPCDQRADPAVAADDRPRALAIFQATTTMRHIETE